MIIVSLTIFFVMVLLGWLLPAFGDATFWDKTYTKSGDNEVVEWFGVDYMDVRHTIRRLMGTQRLRPILNIGSGNSSFPGDLHDAGYRNVVSIDVSTVVLQQMAKRYSRKRELRWLCMDATNMAFDDEIFPLVIDKGTLDAIICTNNPEHWIKTYFKELYRVMEPDGTFMLITGYEPRDVMKYFSRHPWSVEHNEIDGRDGATAHLYLASKVAEVCIHGGDDDSDGERSEETQNLIDQGGMRMRARRGPKVDPDRAPGRVSEMQYEMQRMEGRARREYHGL